MRLLALGVDPVGDVIDELRAEAQESGWADDAVCQRVDPVLWFPEPGTRSTTAVRLCHTCPVMPECRADALTRREQFGVWGGQTEDQRKATWKSDAAERDALIEALMHVDGIATQDETTTGKQAA